MPDNHLNNLSKGAGSFIEEFKAFALKGNIIDLAVAVILGTAFTAVVTALVEKLLMPLLINPILKASGIENFSTWKVGPGIEIGAFLAAVVNFIIIALVLFIVIQKLVGALGKLRRKEEVAEAVAAPTAEEKLLTEIRDLLASQRSHQL